MNQNLNNQNVEKIGYAHPRVATADTVHRIKMGNFLV